MQKAQSFGDRLAPASCEPPALTWSTVALEGEIISVLDVAPEPGERIEFAFRRKEAELVALFARLSIADARELSRRLTLQLDGDPIVARFARMVAARRTRLLAFLADARRREAMRAAKCGTPERG